MSFFLRRAGWRWSVLRRLPRRRHLKGTWIHRKLGERVLDPRLWRPDARTVAGGTAIGIFLGLSPAYGLHVILAIAVAYLLRQNIPAAFVSCWVFNPVTAPLLIAAETWLGSWLAGHVRPEVDGVAESLSGTAMQVAWQLALGSFVLGIAGSAASYALVLFGYRWASRLLVPAREAPPAAAPSEPV